MAHIASRLARMTPAPTLQPMRVNARTNAVEAKCLRCGSWEAKESCRQIVVQWQKVFKKTELVGWHIRPLPEACTPKLDKRDITLEPFKEGLVCGECCKAYPTSIWIRPTLRKQYGGAVTIPRRNNKGQPVLYCDGSSQLKTAACSLPKFYEDMSDDKAPEMATVPSCMFAKDSILSLDGERIKLLKKVSNEQWSVQRLDADDKRPFMAAASKMRRVQR